MRVWIFFLLLAAALLFCRVSAVHAESDFQKDYTVDYFLAEDGGQIQTKVVMNLKLTNLKSGIVAKKFSLAFPKAFSLSSITASNNGAQIAPKIDLTDEDIHIGIDLEDAVGGRGETNNIVLEFYQKNLFKINGNVWEVILPTIDAEDRNSYVVHVHLPGTSTKKISIAKPKPDTIDASTITWENPKTKTIYATFGEKQLYTVKVIYHLVNPKVAPVYTDIALIPDTAYQKIYISDLSPKPSSVYLDPDGNYMARYTLNPRQSYDVAFAGYIEETVKPRDELRDYIKDQFISQKKYLLSTPKYWSSASQKRFSSTEDVYTYVTSTLSYNYNRINEKVERLGADIALADPKNAVCTEFTDVFVSLARTNNLYAREIQGYGYSSDTRLRPLSTQSDILHAWPEYFDASQSLWIPVDPTWGNTSGIDYYNSFDLNHIAFVIHGQRPDYPYPAGTYKQKESKDIEIATTSNSPDAHIDYEIISFNGSRRLHPGSHYTGTLTVRNSGNVYEWNVPIQLSSTNTSIQGADQTLQVLAPYEEKKISFVYSPKNAVGKGTLTVMVDGTKKASFELSIVPFFFDLALLAVPFGACIVFFGLYWARKKTEAV